MWTTNAGLTDRHTYDSRPDSWPRLRRGIVSTWQFVTASTNQFPWQNFWVKDHRQIYLIGNPWVWYLSSAAVVAYMAVRGLLILRAKRGYRDFDSSECILCFTIKRLISENLISQSRKIRFSLWVPVHRLEFTLHSLFYHGSPAVPPSLFSSTLLCYLTILLHFRPGHHRSTSSTPSADGGRFDYYRNLEFPVFQPPCIWKPVDAEEVPECQMVEVLGFILVSLSHSLFMLLRAYTG